MGDALAELELSLRAAKVCLQTLLQLSPLTHQHFPSFSDGFRRNSWSMLMGSRELAGSWVTKICILNFGKEDKVLPLAVDVVMLEDSFRKEPNSSMWSVVHTFVIESEANKLEKRPRVKLTREEERMLQTCKANGVRGFAVGALVTCGLVWAAASKLLSPLTKTPVSTDCISFVTNQLLLSGSSSEAKLCKQICLFWSQFSGAAVVCGMWNCDRTLNSCLEHILATNGSRMQSMLAGIILTRHQDNPKRLQLVKKHFYPEKVFDDSSLDQPFSRWRSRNFFGDIVGQRTHEDIHMAKPTPNQEPKPFTITPAEDVILDPLDCILGYAKPSDELHYAETTGTSLRRRHIALSPTAAEAIFVRDSFACCIIRPRAWIDDESIRLILPQGQSNCPRRNSIRRLDRDWILDAVPAACGVFGLIARQIFAIIRAGYRSWFQKGSGFLTERRLLRVCLHWMVPDFLLLEIFSLESVSEADLWKRH
ncbi:hypothetical protein ACLOJK_033631 [Asimina triloba]